MSIRKAIVSVAVAALAAGLSAGLSGTAHASDPTVPSATWNEIYIPFDNAAGNRLCADVPGGSTSVGAQLQLYQCHGYDSDGAPQRFEFDGSFSSSLGGWVGSIVNVGSHLCIDPPTGPAPVSGVRLVQVKCLFSSTWLIRVQNANGTDPLIELVLMQGISGIPTSLCMAAGNMSDSNHTPLVATTCQPLLPTPADLSQVFELA
jgi:hypothetical protein